MYKIAFIGFFVAKLDLRFLLTQSQKELCCCDKLGVDGGLKVICKTYAY